MSSTVTPGPMEWRQRHADDIEVIQTHLDGRQAQIHTAMPGIIVSFDPAAMTAVVQPALQGIQQKLDGTIAPVTIATIGDVPVHFPNGGGHTLTFPVAAGDECLIMFSERNIDNWFQRGGVGAPNDYRMHDINDCFVMVGLRSQPRVLGAAATGRSSGPATHASAAQLRSDDGNTSITLDGAGGAVTVKTGGVTIVANAGGVTLTAPTVTIVGELHVTGEVIGKFGGPSVTLTRHMDPQGGPPIPGT